MTEECIESVKESIEDSVKRSQGAIIVALSNMVKKTTSGTMKWHPLAQDDELIKRIKFLFRESDETIFLPQSYYCAWGNATWIALNIVDGNDYKADCLISVQDEFVIRCSDFFKNKASSERNQDLFVNARKRFVEMINWLLLEIRQQFLNKSLSVIEQLTPDAQATT
jgi:hypothetical protein